MLIAIDIGGSGIRALGQARDGTRRRAVRAIPSRRALGWKETLDLAAIWEGVGAAVREVAAGASVRAVAVTSARHALVIAGEVELGFGPTDASGAGWATRLCERPDWLERTGRWPAPLFWAPRLLALRDEGRIGPDARVFGLADWVVWKLSGAAVASRTLAGESLLLGLRSGTWWDERIRELGLPMSWFPPVVDAGAVAGSVGSAAASHLGISPGVPVVAAGADTSCALLGASVLRPGQGCIVAGTTTTVQVVCDAAPAHEREAPDRFWTGHHVLPGMRVREANLGYGGNAARWLGELLYGHAPDPVAALCADAASAPSESGVFSTFGATDFDARRLGLSVAHLVASPLMAGDDRRARVARAVVEGMAAGVARACGELGATEPWRVTGGLTRSPFFVQQVADALGAAVEVAEPDATALGALLCATVGVGACNDLVAAAERLDAPDRVEPSGDTSPAWVPIYDSLEPARVAASPHLLAAMAPADDSVVPKALVRPKILVTADLDASSLSELERVGTVVARSYRTAHELLTGDSLVEALAGIEVLVCEVDVVDVDVLNRATDLRAVMVCRGDPVNVDVDAATALGIPVASVPGRNARAVAELTLALALALLRHVVPANAFQHQDGSEPGDMARMGMAHERFQGKELGRSTLGLVGLGAVGKEVARMARGFGARVLAFDPVVDSGAAALAGAELVSLDALLAGSDIVSLHAPVTPETRGMIGAGALSRMRRGALLVNTARAALLDEAALNEALESGHLGGAALDVFSVEPPGAQTPLLRHPNVIALPHLGGNTADVAAHQGRAVVAALEAWVAGGRPRHLRNPDVDVRWSGPRRAPTDAEIAALRSKPGPAVTDLEVGGAEPEAVGVAEPHRPAERRGWMGSMFHWTRRLFVADDGPSPKDGVEPAPRDGDRSAARRQMESVLDAFVDAASRDEALRAFSVGRDVASHYVVPDLDLSFHLVFSEGRVACGLGPPARRPDVTVKMNAEVLDGVFGGTLNGMTMAMSGKLSFTGNTAKAISMQRVQGDVSRLYVAAREARGGVGNLAGLVAAQPKIAGPPAAAPGRAAELAAIVAEMVAAGLVTSTGGNVSVRLGPDEMLVTPSQLPKGTLTAEMMVRTNLMGDPLDPGSRAPTSERDLHGSILKRRPDVNAVLHSHAPNAITMALAGLPFLPISTEAAFLGDLPVVPFLMPGTPELAEAVAVAFGNKGHAVLMQNHGLVVGASSLRRAADLCHIVEDTARQLVACHLLGKTPPVLPSDALEALRRVGDLVA